MTKALQPGLSLWASTSFTSICPVFTPRIPMMGLVSDKRCPRMPGNESSLETALDPVPPSWDYMERESFMITSSSHNAPGFHELHKGQGLPGWTVRRLTHSPSPHSLAYRRSINGLFEKGGEGTPVGSEIGPFPCPCSCNSLRHPPFVSSAASTVSSHKNSDRLARLLEYKST